MALNRHNNATHRQGGETKTRYETAVVVAPLDRPATGPTWHPAESVRDFPLTGLPAWQSNGGPTRKHPARSFPFSFEVPLHEQDGDLARIHVVGIFAMHADAENEAAGTVGASIQLLGSDREIVARYDLVNGRHYGSASDLKVAARVCGDGTSLEKIGRCEIDGKTYRVDILTLDVPLGARPKHFYFKDLNSPASFVIFEVFFEMRGTRAAGVRPKSEAISLADLGTAIRVGDRLKFSKALEQLDAAIDEAENIDEARAHSLAVLSVICSALLETSAHRHEDRLLLDTARELDKRTSRSQLKEVISGKILHATEGLFAPSESASDRLVDRALAIVERHYAKDLSDAMVAAQLGLSTSHFRFLFRQATGHPFHKYVVALRLEKAKQMLIEQELPVSQVASAVGFTALSHFSRAFTQRFSASPSHIRRAAG